MAAFVNACPVFVSTVERSACNLEIEEPWALTTPSIRVTSVVVAFNAVAVASDGSLTTDQSFKLIALTPVTDVPPVADLLGIKPSLKYAVPAGILTDP